MTDLMIDLETLSTSPNALIVSIGAVVFDRHSDALGQMFYRRVDIDHRNGDIDGPTIEWWMKQADKWPPAEGMTLNRALEDFTTFYKTQDISNVWGHGVAFDVPILESSYRRCGLPVPWSHRAPRDTRTLFDLAGKVHVTTSHHALEDAREQARAVQGAMRRLRHG